MPHETDRIGQHHRERIGKVNPPHGRVEGREELVRRVDTRPGQGIEEGGLARVGVTDKRDGGHLGPTPCTASLLALQVHFLEASAQQLDAVAEQSAVGFELGLTWTTQADAAFLPLKVRPAAHEPRGHVPQLRELDLQLAHVGAGTLREDIEDEPRAIDHAALQAALEVALLRRAQCVIEDDQRGLVLAHGLPDLLELAAADEAARVGAMPVPEHEGHRITTGGEHEFLEFPRILAVFVLVEFEVNEYRALTRARPVEEHLSR